MTTINELDCLIFEAHSFAEKAHEGQTRKYTGEPYIVHPRAVANLVAARGGDKAMICAAYLHDVVEDCDVELATIYNLFGPDIGLLVNELTDEYTKENYPELNRRARKSMEADRLGKVSDRAKLIKLCDLADNTKTIVEHDPGFATVYLREKAHLLEVMGFEPDAEKLK